MANKVLRIHTSLFPLGLPGLDIYFMYLGCLIHGAPQGIFLKSMQDVYVRATPEGVMEMPGM